VTRVEKREQLVEVFPVAGAVVVRLSVPVWGSSTEIIARAGSHLEKIGRTNLRKLSKETGCISTRAQHDVLRKLNSEDFAAVADALATE
jgi:hypothetical protein